MNKKERKLNSDQQEVAQIQSGAKTLTLAGCPRNETFHMLNKPKST